MLGDGLPQFQRRSLHIQNVYRTRIYIVQYRMSYASLMLPNIYPVNQYLCYSVNTLYCLFNIIMYNMVIISRSISF